jgi:hypothetical protein
MLSFQDQPPFAGVKPGEFFVVESKWSGPRVYKLKGIQNEWRNVEQWVTEGGRPVRPMTVDELVASWNEDL